MGRITLALKPATLDRVSALEYTGLSEAELCRNEERGLITFKPVGKQGKMVVPTAQLDAMIESIWSQDELQPDEDMDCG